MNRVTIRIPLILSCFALLSSCGDAPEVKEKKKPLFETRLAGRVQVVNRSGNFVLIRRYGVWRVKEGEIVESRGEGRTASLLPSGEKLGEHIAADIQSGQVEPGDGVYIRNIKKSETINPKEEEEKTKPS